MSVHTTPSLNRSLRDNMSVLRPLLCCASLCALASPAIAQTSTITPMEYRVSGIVRDGSGNALDNAEVSLLTGGIIRIVVPSKGDGQFNLGNFTAGKAMLQIRRVGYEKRNFNITIGADQKPTYVEIVLHEIPQKL